MTDAEKCRRGQIALGFWFALMNLACAIYPDKKPEKVERGK